MILITDSGSTKTDLRWISNGEIIDEATIPGINPFYQTSEDIKESFATQLRHVQETTAVFHYGAGCAFPEKCQMVQHPLTELYPRAEINVYSDLLGAARSICQRKEGIACILGTGSNSCFYNGKEIVQNVSPLGFILGDEGSGAVLGKLLVGDILKGVAPKAVCQSFFEEEETTPAILMDHIYKQPFPNRYLAQFARFIHRHKNSEYCHSLLTNAFGSFFERNISQYPNHLECSFVGSIAHYFQDELREAATIHHRSIGTIVKSPMHGLVAFHSN